VTKHYLAVNSSTDIKMRIKLIVLLLCLGSINTVRSEPNLPTTEQKKKWEGKLVFDEIKGEHFFQSLNLKPRLKSLLSAADFNRVTTNVVTSPMIIEQGWLLYSGCTPHACGDAIRIALNTHNNAILVSVSNHQVQGKNHINYYSESTEDAIPLKVLAFIEFTWL
jgi:hypothetical protein